MDSLIAKVFLILFVIIGLVSVGTYGFTTVRSGMETGNQALGDVEKMNQALLENEYTKYDATEITGSQVVNLIKKYEQEKTRVCIQVNNGRSVTEYVYASDLTTVSDKKAVDAKNKTDLATYINPSSMFLGEVVRDADTDAITGLIFTKQ